MAAPTDRDTYRILLIAMLDNSTLPGAIDLSASDLDSVLDAAVEEFGHDHPLVKVKSLTGDGTKKRYVADVDIDSGWAQGFSAIRELRLHSNTDANARGRNLKQEEFAFFLADESGTTKDVLLLSFAHSATEDLDVTYVLRHDIDTAPITIPAAELYALANLSASHGATWIASRASDQKDTQISADAVDYGAIAEKYSTRAEEWRNLYERTVKADEMATTASFVEMQEPLQDQARRNTHFRYPRRP